MKNPYLNNLTFAITLFLLLLMVYWPVYKFEFLIGWDDQWFVTNHYTENGFSWANISRIFTEFYYGQYAPINQLYYTSLYGIFGYTPGYYHISSIIIHFINCILIFTFIKGFLGDIDSKIDGNNFRIAFLSAIIFAILPINVEPVSWVAASKVLIYAMFYVLALIFYRKYLNSKKSLFFYLTGIALLFSFGAKEQAVVLPFCLILMDYLYARNMRDKLVWLEKLPYFILALILGLATIDSQQIDKNDFYTIYQRIPLFFYSLSEYITKCIFPVNLSYLYPFPFLKSDDIPKWLWIHVLFIPVILFCFFEELTKKKLLFCSFFFLINIILTCNLFSLARYSLVADRYVYIAAIAPCMLVALFFIKYCSSRYKLSSVLKLAGIVYLVVLMWTSHKYVLIWKNTNSLKNRLKTTIEARTDFQKLKANER